MRRPQRMFQPSRKRSDYAFNLPRFYRKWGKSCCVMFEERKAGVL